MQLYAAAVGEPNFAAAARRGARLGVESVAAKQILLAAADNLSLRSGAVVKPSHFVVERPWLASVLLR